MSITLAQFRAQSNFAGYQVQPYAVAQWDEALQELVIGSAGSAGVIPSAFLNSASPNITAGAYVTFVASLSDAASGLGLYNGSSTPIILATGAAASEVDKALIFPGTTAYLLTLSIAAGTRLSLKSTSGTVSVGIVGVNFVK